MRTDRYEIQDGQSIGSSSGGASERAAVATPIWTLRWTAIGALIVVLIAFLATASKTHRVAGPRCQTVKVVVTLPDDADRSIHYRIAGQLCAVGLPAGNRCSCWYMG
jgi:hypothetical protein